MTTSISADRRTNNGKGAARKLRAVNQIPGVIYAKGREATPISLNPTELLAIYRRTGNRNTILDVQLDGSTVRALVQEAQRHPVSRELLHVDLLAVEDGDVVERMVPVRPVGRPSGATFGGRIRLIRREVRVRARFDRIPEFIDVDVTPMEIGDVVDIDNVPTDEGVDIVFKQSFHVLSCYGKKKTG